MKLTANQKEFYKENGYLILENLLTKEEVQLIKSKITGFDDCKHLPNVICEENGDVRSIFAPHNHDKLFERFYQDERFAKPGEVLIGKNIYLYQYKINLKKPFSGQAWEWHQDFPYWKLDDGVPSPDMISVMVYLDDTRSYQGPLMVIPGSHKFDVVDFQDKPHLEGSNNLLNSLNADLKYTVNERLVKKFANDHDIHVLEYKAGTAIFFHPNLFHASCGNLSPYDRDTVIMTYNSVHNIPIKRNNRPEYICSTDYTSIKPVDQAVLI